MGGDYAPANVVKGSLDALLESGGRFSLLLVGKEELVREELQKHPGNEGLKHGSYEIANAR